MVTKVAKSLGRCRGKTGCVAYHVPHVLPNIAVMNIAGWKKITIFNRECSFKGVDVSLPC